METQLEALAAQMQGLHTLLGAALRPERQATPDLEPKQKAG